ncbi:fibrillin-3-like isoform X2 [Macrobrachium rosenbergii]|uniref:fibrillin-3-like isoform X2 n=1 Tax=Macrobrachium rosenbergii TaxID=79674 RepID=UPI0034D62843
MRRRTRRLPPFLLLLFLPLVVHTQDDVSDNETTVVMLKSTEEVPAVTESVLLNNETEGEAVAPSNITNVLGEVGEGVEDTGSLSVGDAAAATGGPSEETTTTVSQVSDTRDPPGAENVTDALLGVGGAVTEPPNVNVTEEDDVEVTEEQEVTTGKSEMTTEVVTSKPEAPSPATKAPPPETTIAPKCGVNAQYVEGACKCLAGWAPDPSNGSALSCLCPDLCGTKGTMSCPDNAQCYHVACSVVSCQCEEKGKYYNPLDGTCVDACAYYGNVLCGLASNKTCQLSNSTDVGYTCSCSKGFYLRNDTCLDFDECTENPCGDGEECLNSIGSYSCVCKQGYLRTSTGTCSNINECRNPLLNGCDHLCEDQTPGFACKCHEGFVLSEDTEKCQLDSSTSCECSDPTRSICYRPSGGEPQCHPKPGFKLLNGSYEDEAECARDAEEWCGAHGECVEGEGSSHCRCRQGFLSNASNAAECLAVECPVGTVLSGSSCVDPCTLVKCLYPLRCVATEEGRGECVCGILCQGLMNPEGIASSVYDGTLIAMMPSAPESVIASKVTRTLSAYFGKGNVEVTGVQLQSKRKPRSTDTPVDTLVEFSVTTDLPNRSHELTDVIKKQCLLNVDLPDGTCVLPGQIVVSENSIIVEVKDPCKDSPCPSTLFDCIPRRDVSGRHLCSCKSGYVKVAMRGMLAFCEDIDECNNTTKKRCKGDQECLNTPGSFVCREPAGKLTGESTMKDIAVAFGILFAATLLIAIGLGYLLMKKSHRVRELVPMTETNSGFENHAFHK